MQALGKKYFKHELDKDSDKNLSNKKYKDYEE